MSSRQTNSYTGAEIAVVGMAGRFPGAQSVEEFWQNLRAGVEQGRFSFTAFVENLFDENYYTGTFDDLFWSGIHVRVHPRTWGVRLTARY